MLCPLHTDKVFSNFLLFTKAFWPEETVTQPQHEVTVQKHHRTMYFLCGKNYQKNFLNKINSHSLNIWCNATELNSHGTNILTPLFCKCIMNTIHFYAQDGANSINMVTAHFKHEPSCERVCDRFIKGNSMNQCFRTETGQCLWKPYSLRSLLHAPCENVISVCQVNGFDLKHCRSLFFLQNQSLSSYKATSWKLVCGM